MQPSHARLSGHLDLCILDPDGRVLERHANHNTVGPFGQELIPSALQGQTSTQRLEPFLAEENFELGRESSIEQDGVVKLWHIEPLEANQEGSRLVMGYRGVAEREGKIVGGGVSVVYRRKGSQRNLNGIYNFAKTRATVEVRPEMPLLSNFTLTVGQRSGGRSCPIRSRSSAPSRKAFHCPRGC